MANEVRIEMNVSDERFLRSAKNVETIVCDALHILKKKNIALEIHLLTDKEMQRVNKATRGKNVPTNVLSFEADGFPYGEGESPVYIGEIYLAPDVIKERKESIKFLAIHGLFHLFGYTHEEKRDTIKMERAEDSLLAKLAANNSH